jgi:S-adenosylmethionine:tRNA ribosyltransferase-isomerase
MIAQHPLARRDDSRLLHLPAGGDPRHLAFKDLPDLLRDGDLLVVNDTRVIPARIRFEHRGAPAEILLLNPDGRDGDTWECLVRPGKKARPGARLQIRFGLWADVLAESLDGTRKIRFAPPGRLRQMLPEIGEVPLPPYIKETLADPERYQTMFARREGSAAAPTAGLHFTEDLLRRLADRGVERVAVNLRIGLDTFQPLRVDALDEHRMHSEKYSIPARAQDAIAACRERGGRVVAVGTTVVRALEAWAITGEAHGSTDVFIRPGWRFQVVDLMVTNFHLPRSTLLVLVSAFAGRERILRAYAEAVREGYRFYSFGDAMLLEREGGA